MFFGFLLFLNIRVPPWHLGIRSVHQISSCASDSSILSDEALFTHHAQILCVMWFCLSCFIDWRDVLPKFSRITLQNTLHSNWDLYCSGNKDWKFSSTSYPGIVGPGALLPVVILCYTAQDQCVILECMEIFFPTAVKVSTSLLAPEQAVCIN